jgi:hypothetical protein
VICKEEEFIWSEDDEYVKESSLAPVQSIHQIDQDRDNNIIKGIEDFAENNFEDKKCTIKSESVSSKMIHPTFVVAASAKSGLGFDDFVDSLSNVLSLFLKTIEVFIPYSKDEGIIAQIHNQGVADIVEYKDMGTYIKCRVPDALHSKLAVFKIRQ